MPVITEKDTTSSSLDCDRYFKYYLALNTKRKHNYEKAYGKKL